MTTTKEDLPQRSRSSMWVFGLLPLIVLGAVLLAFARTNPLSDLRRDAPPVEELTIGRVALQTNPHRVVVYVTNGGPQAVTIAQVKVDDAYWNYRISPGPRIARLGRATIHLPYPWVEGEAVNISLISSTGVNFTHDIAAAVETPGVTGKTLVTFTLLGLFVGVLPVLIGLGWFPFIRRLHVRWVNFFLALTAGLLVFLAVEALDEGLSAAGKVPGAFQGVGLVLLGVVGALAALYALDGAMRRRRGGSLSPYYVAVLIAIGIGLHNLGEGLAIGASFALGEIGLGTFLILGFTLHNVTEGLGIVTPLAKSSPRIGQLIALGLVAGLPTIVGTWTGGLVYSPILAVLFLSIGAGAIIQVVWEIGKLLTRESRQLSAPLNALGFASGILLMYLTGLAVAS
jgi:zinc transporter, ZIP family